MRGNFASGFEEFVRLIFLGFWRRRSNVLEGISHRKALIHSTVSHKTLLKIRHRFEEKLTKGKEL